MKFFQHTLTAAAVLACTALSAQAATVSAGLNEDFQVGGTVVQLNAGSGALSFSSGSAFDGVDVSTIGGLIGALNVGKVAITAISPATYAETALDDGFGEMVRVSAKANAPVVGVKADSATGEILEVSSVGGARQLGTRISGTLNGGRADVTNLRFDLANKVVYADLVGRSNALGTRPAVDYVLTNQALWNIGAISGPTVIPPSLAGKPEAEAVALLQASGFSNIIASNGFLSFTASNKISGLTVTQAGFDFFKNSLALLSTGVNALNAVNDDPQGWGEVDSILTFSTPITPVVPGVPEPSTYAMTFGGLAVAGLLAARRRREV